MYIVLKFFAVRNFINGGIASEAISSVVNFSLMKHIYSYV